MTVEFLPSVLRGEVSLPSSKSMFQRYLIAASLADGESILHGVADAEDVQATIDCLSALGADIRQEGARVLVRGWGNRKPAVTGPLFCRESAATLRFLIPLCLDGAEHRFCGEPSLLSRPLSVYEALAAERGFSLERRSARELAVCGRLTAGEYRLAGDVSSQFISGLLFALPLLAGDSRVLFTTKPQSFPYLRMTAEALSHFGVRVDFCEDGIFIPGGQRYLPADLTVEGDASAAANLAAFNLFPENRITLSGLPAGTLQGDAAYAGYFEKLAHGYAEIPLENTPDLAPICMAVAAVTHGARYTGTARLRYKESDRAAVMAQELAKFGVAVTVRDKDISVDSSGFHAPDAPLSSHGDHRIAMALSFLLAKTGGVLCGAESVAKSYPGYFDALRTLGARMRRDEATRSFSLLHREKEKN